LLTLSFKGVQDDDDEEPVKAERDSGHNFTYDAKFKVEDPMPGTQSSPIEIPDDEEVPLPRKRMRLTPSSTPVKKERHTKVERDISTTPLKIRLRRSRGSSTLQTSSSPMTRFFNPNDSLSPSTFALLKPEAETEKPQSAIHTPLRPQLRQPRSVIEQRGRDESPISSEQLQSQKRKTPLMIERDDKIGYGLDLDINSMHDNVVTKPMTIEDTEGTTFVDSSTTIAVDEDIASDSTPDNRLVRDFSTEQVFILADLAEVQLPPECNALLSESRTGLPAFLQLAKTRIKQKIDLVDPVDARPLLQALCDDAAGKEPWIAERDDWILLQGLSWCDAGQRMVLLEDGVPDASARLRLRCASSL